VRNTFLVLLLLVMCIPSLTYGEQPLDALQKCIDTGISILQDPQYQHASRREAQQQKLCRVTQHIFDYHEFSKRALGSKWKTFTTDQKNELMDVFSQFLAKFYLNQLIEKYNDEYVGSMSRVLIDDNKAEITMDVVMKGMEVPVQLKMLRRNETWKVYDVKVMGVSALWNYRAQFKFVLLKDSPDQLIGRLKKKVRKLDQERQQQYAEKSKEDRWF
jgi:phospholipid transport system substrate-binding protein